MNRAPGGLRYIRNPVDELASSEKGNVLQHALALIPGVWVSFTLVIVEKCPPHPSFLGESFVWDP
jgi:hypothetical protein